MFFLVGATMQLTYNAGSLIQKPEEFQGEVEDRPFWSLDILEF